MVITLVYSCLQIKQGTWITWSKFNRHKWVYLVRIRPASTVGDQQLRRPEESTTTSDNGESTSRSERVVLEKLLLPSEIMNMPNLAGVLCLGKDFLPVPVEIPLVKKDRRILPFVAKKHPALSVPAAAPADPAPAPAPSAAPVVQTAPVAAAPSIAAPDLD